MWTALVRSFGEPLDDDERGQYRLATKRFLAKGASPGDVEIALRCFQTLWENAEATPLALAKHLNHFKHRESPKLGMTAWEFVTTYLPVSNDGNDTDEIGEGS